MNNNIIINFDFTTGNELSYLEGKMTDVPFETNCLEFFNTDNINAVVIKSDGSFIKVRSLLFKMYNHTNKDIRNSHDIRKMLIANAFKWQPKEL